jgi:hypothetical protein
MNHPSRLRLEESDGSARIIFAVLPKWAYLLPIVFDFVIGLVHLAVDVAFAELVWSLTKVGPAPPPDLTAQVRRIYIYIFLVFGVNALGWCAAGVYHWWVYHRWGRVPRTLTANNQGLAVSRLTEWRMRERWWPVSEIAAIELRPVKGNLNWTRTVADLYIRRQNGRRLRFRLSSPNAQLPGQIATGLAAALQRPLV